MSNCPPAGCRGSGSLSRAPAVAGAGPWGLGGCWAVILFCPLVLMALLFKHRKCRFILTLVKS